ncbi:hypothetical protein [Nitratireductor luteus]|uniref:hypothetical protein n=1 Tax=Nitratireductor luteus TaxID=2976980 RepID=UPI00223EDBB7|nr:hypothetical protein [Nitratireductor luteus]
MSANKSSGEKELREMARPPRRSKPPGQNAEDSRLLPAAPQEGSAPGSASGAGAGDGGFSMWGLADPDAAARAALDLFGPSTAATAAAEAAFTARYAGREADFRFWFATFIRLRGLAADDGKAS